MCILTITNKNYMTYEFFFEQTMQMIELKVKMTIDINPHLTNALEKRTSHSSNRKTSIQVKTLEIPDD